MCQVQSKSTSGSSQRVDWFATGVEIHKFNEAHCSECLNICFQKTSFDNVKAPPARNESAAKLLSKNNDPPISGLLKSLDQCHRLFRQGLRVRPKRATHLPDPINLIRHRRDRAGNEVELGTEDGKILLEKRGQFALQFFGVENPLTEFFKVVMLQPHHEILKTIRRLLRPLLLPTADQADEGGE